MTILFYFLVFVLFFLYFRFKIKVHQYPTLFIYFCILTFNRIIMSLFYKVVRRKKVKKVEPVIVEKTRFERFEISLGKDQFGNQIIVDFENEHTLLGASSGGGKTVMLHWMLVQLFGKGLDFINNVDVYLIDLKGNPQDKLHIWEPVISRFIRPVGNDLSEVIEVLNHLDSQLSEELDKKVLLLIDDGISILQDREARNVLLRIASRIRANGAFLLTIQNAKGTILDTFIRSNIGRRICGLVTEQSQAKTILGVNIRDIPEERSEYIIREPGKKGLTKFKNYQPDILDLAQERVPEIIKVISEQDPNLKLLLDVTRGKRIGDTITGIRKQSQVMDIPNAQRFVNDAYQEFAQMEIFSSPEKRGESYKLLTDNPISLYKRLKNDTR